MPTTLIAGWQSLPAGQCNASIDKKLKVHWLSAGMVTLCKTLKL